MPLINATSESTGTGDLTVEGLTASIANGTSLNAYISNERDFGGAAFEWEYSSVTYNDGVITRDSVVNSSASGELVDFSVGTKLIIIDYPTGVDSANSSSKSTIGVSINASTKESKPIVNICSPLPPRYSAMSSHILALTSAVTNKA